jgi:hypothetical protein
MTSDQTEAPMICVVCGEPAEPRLSAECNWCDGRYHLNQRNDIEEKDCGRVWIDEQFLALQFACNNCLSGEQKPAPTPTAHAPRRRYRRRE